LIIDIIACLIDMVHGVDHMVARLLFCSEMFRAFQNYYASNFRVNVGGPWWSCTRPFRGLRGAGEETAPQMKLMKPKPGTTWNLV
jgi:hypothetical protein